MRPRPAMTSCDAMRDAAASPSTATPRVVSSSRSRSQSVPLGTPLPPQNPQPSRGGPTTGGRRLGRDSSPTQVRISSTWFGHMTSNLSRGDRETERISGEPRPPSARHLNSAPLLTDRPAWSMYRIALAVGSVIRRRGPVSWHPPRTVLVRTFGVGPPPGPVTSKDSAVTPLGGPGFVSPRQVAFDWAVVAVAVGGPACGPRLAQSSSANRASIESACDVDVPCGFVPHRRSNSSSDMLSELAPS